MCLVRESILRRVQNLSDVQIVLNDILNRIGPLDNSILNRRGFKITGLGDGTTDTDAATISQLNKKPDFTDLPSQANVDHHYTIVWSNQFAPSTVDIIPAFCIVNDDRVGQITALWAAARTPGTVASLKINLNIGGNDGNNQIAILTEDLELLENKNGPVFSSKFISPIPFFGIGSFIYPVINQVGGQSSVTIGATVKKSRRHQLA